MKKDTTHKWLDGRRCLVTVVLACVVLASLPISAQASETGAFDGLTMNAATLPRLSNAKTRSITPENPTGEKGKGRYGDCRHGGLLFAGVGPGLARLTICVGPHRHNPSSWPISLTQGRSNTSG